MRALILLCLTLMAVSPANAELRDLRARMSGDEGLIWLAFDGQPTLMRSELSATGLELVVEGVSVSVHQIIPRDRALVTGLQVEPTDSGARILLQGHQPWTGAEAELRQGGVLVRVRLAAGEPAAQSASTYPAPDPAWTPTPVPAATAAVHAPGHAPDHAPDRASDQATAEAPAPAPAQPGAAAPAALTAGTDTTPPATPQPGPARASTVPAQAAATAAAALPVDVTACAAAAAAVEANPWDDTGLMRHAACLGRAGDTGQASRIYEQMLAFEPGDVTALLALADMRLQQGNRTAARSLYLRAAEHATSDAQAMHARSQAMALRPE